MSEVIGKTLGQYQVLEQIGKGGMATVYKAYQPSIDRYVALKILPKQFAEDPNFVKRFAQEAKAIAALEHPHILPVYDYGTQDGLTYMVMRYVKGGTLANLMGAPMSDQRIVSLISDVAMALHYAHEQGVVHRDVKPSNILIDKLGEPLLTDFGIAKIIEGAGATQLTSDGNILGTPAYMSPEQAKGTNIDRRSDIYALGVILYELLTGRPPYQAETPLAIVLMHLNEPLPPLRQINPNIAEPLEWVVLKAMAKEPSQRYQTAAELAQALQGALKEIESGAQTTSHPPASTIQTQGVPSPTPQPAPAKKSMAPLFIGGGIVALLLCLAGSAMAAFFIFPPGNVIITPTAGRATVSIGPESTPTPASVADATPTPDLPTPTLELIEPNRLLEPLPIVPGADGQILFEERFESNRNDWPTGESMDEYGVLNSELIDGRYQMSYEAKKGVFSWNNLGESEFDNFVLSVEATPVEHSAAVAYGLTFRENAGGDLYSFEIDSDGLFIVNLLVDDEWQTLVDYTESAAINKSGSNQLLVKAIGPQLSFYINGEEVTTLEDETLDSGLIGVAMELYEAGDTAVVEFDNLIVRQLIPAEQPQVQKDNGIIFEDTFDSDGSGWGTGEFEDKYSQSEVTIEEGRYTLAVTSKTDDSAYVEKELPSRRFSDFILTVDATPRDNEPYYSYGVAFREDDDGNVYTLQINNRGQYSIFLYNQEWQKLKDWSSTPAIKGGQTNRLIVTAKGPSLTFYVNDQQLTTLTDKTLPEGKVNLLVEVNENGKSATVDFDNLVIRKP